MDIESFPEKLTRSNNDLFLIQDSEDAAFKKMLVSTLLSNLSGGGGGLTPWQTKSTNYTALAGERIIANTEASSWTLTFPTNPSLGDEIEILPLTSAASNKLIVEGLSIFEGKPVVLLRVDKPYKIVKLTYINNAIGWVQNFSQVYAVYPASSLLYVSNGDINGVFYFIGTNKNIEAWTNPYTAGRIGIFYSSFLSGQSTIESLVDSQPSFFHTQDQSNPFIGFDLLAGKNLLINYWSYRARSNDPSYIPNRLILSGSNDGINYTQLSDQTFTVTQNNWVSFPVPNQTISYRYFKFLYPASTYFTAGEFELYGNLSWN